MDAHPPTRRRCASALLALSVAVALGACAGDDDGGDAPTARPPVTQPPQADARDVRVVRAWADALRHGDVAAAAARFGVPAVVANGSPPLRLTGRDAVRAFNRSLPCGARLTSTAPAPHGFLIASFRLTERPGAGTCGSGTGSLARVAFRIRAGRIVSWLRVRDARRGPTPTPTPPAAPPVEGQRS